ncbi:MAG: hypothetical protein KH100_15375 [Dysgonomonas mossii]|uniref:hypothetical protein n=1 Tax=Dysgonomonas mossii TaxID=163665 RepID=UPI001DDC38A2|nr:hypothetical protein [Dysgonomonas mossii]MBS5798022.1 hypothetical protein [Dysgonomonas mossii]MBS7112563.1 hypothetical protein [Dysgonomonas mossii]
MKTIKNLLVLVSCYFCFSLSNNCSAQSRNIFRLNCDSLISIYKKNSIRSVLPESMSYIYMKPSIKGQFVRYILIADSMLYNEPAGDIIGSIVVYEIDSCHKKALFIEFISNIFPTISLYNGRLQVGSPADDLVEILGTPYKIIENYYLYKDKGNNLIGIFDTQKGKITNFRIGKYNEKILNSIDTELNLLLNHNP